MGVTTADYSALVYAEKIWKSTRCGISKYNSGAVKIYVDNCQNRKRKEEEDDKRR